MTPTEARDILDRLGWSQTYLIQTLGRDSSRTRKQLRGAEPIDEPLADWLRKLGRAFSDPAVQAFRDLVDNPPPKPGNGGIRHEREHRPFDRL